MRGRNRLVPRLLGITRESVLRVDENTKEVLKAWPLTTVRRWAASPNSFTLVSGCGHTYNSSFKFESKRGRGREEREGEREREKEGEGEGRGERERDLGYYNTQVMTVCIEF